MKWNEIKQNEMKPNQTKNPNLYIYVSPRKIQILYIYIINKLDYFIFEI